MKGPDKTKRQLIEEVEGLGKQLVKLKRAEAKRQRVNKQLWKTEETFKALAESANDGIAVAIGEGLLVYVNKRAGEITGYSIAELLKKTVKELMHPDELEKVMERYRKRLAGKPVSLQYETTIIRKDGKIVPIEITGAKTTWHGQPANLVIIREITERKGAEAALRESEERYRRLVENSLLGIGISRGDQIVFANPALLRLFGYEDLEEFRKIPLLNHVAPASHKLIATRMEKIAQGEPVPVEFEYDILRKDGQTKTLLASSQHFTLGGETYSQTTFQDITERKQAEEKLQESEKKYRTVVEISPDGIAIASKGRHVFANQRLARIFGVSDPDELLGKPVMDYIHPDYYEIARERIETLSRGGASVPLIEEKMIRADGTVVQTEVAAAPLEYQGEQAVLAIIRDISERKQAEEKMASLQEQLRQSQKMEAIGRLAGGIAHDFNNLLTVIKGYSQLSLLELKKDTPLRGNVEQIHRATDRATDLVRQLLAFGRCQILEMKVLDLNAILKNLHSMLRRVIGEDIELIAVLAEDLGRIRTDPGWIEQAIMNLVVNARDAMAAGGKLTIETENVDLDEAYMGSHAVVRPGRYVMLSVSDTGVGITREVMERLFEPFFSTKAKDKGTGLGLSTVYGIVKQSGGDIAVYSEPGKGATFEIYLPRAEEPLDELREKVSGEKLLRGRETILLVEDEEDVRKLAVIVLERQGYRVLSARNGDEALILCEQHKDQIHLMLTDVVMPGMNGRELAKRLESSHPETKVLYMSGYTDHAIVAHGALVEGVYYIQKPFTVDALAKKVREVLER